MIIKLYYNQQNSHIEPNIRVQFNVMNGTKITKTKNYHNSLGVLVLKIHRILNIIAAVKI